MSVSKIKLDYHLPSVILLLVGGSLILVGGLVSLAWSSMFAFMNSGMMDYGMMDYGMMMGNMMNDRMMWTMNNQLWHSMILGFSVAGISSGIIVITSGFLIYRKPSNAQLYGIIALVFSIIGFLGMGGFVIGSILGILGGILALFLKK